MPNALFIYLSKAAWARQIVTGWPVARGMATRFVAGDTLEEAIQAIRTLNAKGIAATLDHLGENITTAEESRQATQDILKALDAIQAAGVRANVSIKLTQIGLALDQGLCLENLSQIARRAAEQNNFIRVDMEDTSVTQVTQGLMRQARRYNPRTGIVIQSYLYRSESDIKELMAEGISVRLCKGAYKEPPLVAFPRKSEVDANYDRLAMLLMDAALRRGAPRASADGKVPPLPCLATHDEKRILFAREYARKIGLPPEALEFQMLYGIRRDLQEQLAREGFPVRVYVPYGTQWYPYFMRRLAERPANVWFIVSNFLRK